MASEDGELFKQMREEQQQRRANRLPGRQEEILLLINQGYTVRKLSEYQYRINEAFDVYPIHNRYHNLKTGQRGGYKNMEHFLAISRLKQNQ